MYQFPMGKVKNFDGIEIQNLSEQYQSPMEKVKSRRYGDKRFVSIPKGESYCENDM